MTPTEEELHAYLDGMLPQDRRAAVEAHLRGNPRDAERLEAYRADGEAIARLFSCAGETTHIPAPAIRRRGLVVSTFWRRAAAIAVIAVGTATAGLLWRNQSEEAHWARLGSDALAAHMALGEVGSVPAAIVSLPEISRFLTTATGQPRNLRNPDDRAYALIGSRLWTSPDGSVAQLSFRLQDGNLITMFLQPWPRAADTPFRPVARQSDLRTLAWVDDEIFCAVSGALPPAELERVAREIYRAILS
jgi:anti-sigma factor RsiW